MLGRTAGLIAPGACALILCMAAPFGAAFAQAPLSPTAAPAAAAPSTITLRVDNDAFDFWMAPWNRPDDEYTSGVHLTYDGADAPWWARRWLASYAPCTFGATACRTQRLELGQDMYTPARSVDDPQPASQGRPNAGWLYLSQGARVLRAARSDELTVTLGVTGPPSLAQQTQQLAHDVAPAYNRPTDWHDQVAFAPGVIIRYAQERRFVFSNGAIGADVVPRLAVDAGNVRDAAELGADLRIGWRLPHPWLPGREPLSVTLTAGAAARAVAYDLLLDGRTVHPTPGVGHEPFIGAGDAALEIRYRALRIAYRAESDTRAYAAGPAWHPWASLIGGVTFDR